VYISPLLIRPTQPKATFLIRPTQPKGTLLIRPTQPKATLLIRPTQPKATLLIRPTQPKATLLIRPDFTLKRDHLSHKAIFFQERDCCTNMPLEEHLYKGLLKNIRHQKE
jgi:hypothetical protein